MSTGSSGNPVQLKMFSENGDMEDLEEAVNNWLRKYPEYDLINIVPAQSGFGPANRTIYIFYRKP